MAVQPIPEGYPRVTPYLNIAGAADAIDFYCKVLGASDTLTFTESWRPERGGSYTAVASLLSENYPTEQRAAFSLPAKTVSVR